MGIRLAAKACIGLFYALPALGMEVNGLILDKQGTPIADAKTCLALDPGVCARTDIQGRFRLDPTAFLAPQTRTGHDITWEIRPGELILFYREAANIQAEFFGADGSLRHKASAAFAEGKANVAFPQDGSGIRYARVRGTGWERIIILNPAQIGQPPAGSGVSPSLAKGSAADTRVLIATAPGFNPRLFAATWDSTSEGRVILRAVSDSGYIHALSAAWKILDLDKGEGRMRSRKIEMKCGASGWAPDTTLDSTRFVIKEGRLYLYRDSYCTGQVLEGGGKDLIATWKSVAWKAVLPPDIRPPICRFQNSDLAEFSGSPVSETRTYSDTGWTEATQYEDCPGQGDGEAIFMIRSDSLVKPVRNTCKEVAFRNRKGQEGVFTYAYSHDSLAHSFTYGAKVCSYRSRGFAPRTCPVPENGYDAYLACIQQSGFTEKPPALPKVGPARRPNDFFPCP
jgi:hypothetical protein